MQIHIRANDGVPIYVQIVNQVKYLVACGRLAAEQELPGIRTLAEELLVNPNTVARAYRELEREGIVKQRPGLGTYVSGAGSAVAAEEGMRIISEQVERLLAEAGHMKMSAEDVIELIKQRQALRKQE